MIILQSGRIYSRDGELVIRTAYDIKFSEYNYFLCVLRSITAAHMVQTRSRMTKYMIYSCNELAQQYYYVLDSVYCRSTVTSIV